MSLVSMCSKMFKCNSSVCWQYLVCCLFLFVLTKDCVLGQEYGSPALDFSRHSLVQPVVHHSRRKRAILSTLDSDGSHHDELTVTVGVEGVDYVLDLRLDKALIPSNHLIRYQQNGKEVLRKPSKEELDLCQYRGTIRGMQDSWAAVSTCRGIRGVLYNGQKILYIEPKGVNIQSDHYLYDHGDLSKTFHCGYRDEVTNNTIIDKDLSDMLLKNQKSELSRVSRYKRSAEEVKVRGPYNANKRSRYVELVLVVDNQEYKANGESLSSVHRQCKDLVNIINALYAPLNIFIALVGLEVWTDQDQIRLEEIGDNVLSEFLKYRRETLLRKIPNDNAHLLTRQTFKDGVVGKAHKGTICTYQLSGGVATNHSTVIGLVATTIAHEMGHNFGMEHDNEQDCTCPDFPRKCIMNPSSSYVTPTHWSSCSLKSLALSFERGMDYCLRNKPAELYESPTCGNGFVEQGEQCDCGLQSAPSCHACCHASTCMLRSNATCATGECCDLQSCRPRSAGHVCRSADQECDLPEFCTGHSEFCPPDVHKMDSMPCDNDKAYCAHGTCRSHTDQCRLLWGSTGLQSHDNCYIQKNINDTEYGNCGYDRLNQKYMKCALEDVLCGRLHCRHLNERLEFGMESAAKMSHTFINQHGTVIPCRTATIDMGLSQVDPGLVPDGAKCGEGKMCKQQRCLSVTALRLTIAALEDSVCPSDCSGHGVCNSLGHCHCQRGFSPPLCELPGPGGSVDSGPATNPSIQRNFMVTMYIIFLGIIPTIILVLFLVYYSRHNVILWWKQPRKSLQSPNKGSLQRRLSRGASKFAANFQSSSHSQNQTLPPISVHTLSSPDDMSSSLLRSDSDHSPSGNVNPGVNSVNFFGNFKGFSLTPLERAQVSNLNKEEAKADKPVSTISRFNKNDGQGKSVKGAVEVINVNKSAKILPVHRSGSNSQTLITNPSNVKPVLRSAPPLPVVPLAAKEGSPTAELKRNNSSVQDRIKALIGSDKSENLPPSIVSNSVMRPTISSPILEASTCTAKELISPLQGSKTLGPARAAPSVPGASPDLPKRPLSMAGNVLSKPLPEEPKKVREGISLNRIASFLKQEKPKEKVRTPVERSHSLPKNANHQVKLMKSVDKTALRNLQISNPILQKQIELSVSTVPVVSDSEDLDEPQQFVNRAQSMRGPAVAVKPPIQSFGSMRQPSGVTRPLSVAIAGRPTAPPPPRPNPPQPMSTDTSNSSPGYQVPRPPETRNTDYVDCIGEKQAPLAHIDEESPTDNIYAVIEEPLSHSNTLPNVAAPLKIIPKVPPETYNTPKPVASNSGSSESMGLLGEIVCEIQNRNFDSIYSTSTLARKKKERERRARGEETDDSTYMNTDQLDAPESDYGSNGGVKSSAASTTSSGYLHPSAVNVPTYLHNRPQEPIDNIANRPKVETPEKSPPSPTLKGPNSKIPTFSRQVTPPGLRPTSTFRNVPSSPKTPKATMKALTINSPDVVSSCAVADAKPVKAPDVINNNSSKSLPDNAPKIASKPVLPVKNVSEIIRQPLKPVVSVDKKTAPPKVNTTNKISGANLNTSNKSQSDKSAANSKSNAKVDNSVKNIADNLNKNKPKPVPKPSTISVQRTESGASKPATTKLSSRPSNVASLQQKFENRKSAVGRDTTLKK